MVPYFTLPNLVWLNLDPFSYLLICGILSGYFFARLRARQYGVDSKTFHGVFLYTAIPALLGSDLLQPLMYRPRKLAHDPLLLFQFFDGMSSFAGLFCYCLGFICFIRFRRPATHWLVLADIVLQGAIVGWVFGRLACTVTHDHPGIRSNFFLAVQYPEGPRHDLGFYEFLFFIVVIFPISLYIHRSRQHAGTQAAVLALLYAPFRLFADSLRVRDIRYFHWTPGQYSAVVLLVFGYWLVVKVKRLKIAANRNEKPSNPP